MTYLALLALAALDAAGYSVIAPIIPEIGRQTGSGPGIAGALVACFALGQFVGYPFAGRAVQLRSASWVLGASLVLVAAGDIGFAAGDSLVVYFPSRFVQGLGAGGLWLGVIFAVLERFPAQTYQRLTGLFAAYSVGAIAGSGIAAVGGIRAPFLLHLGLVAVAAVALATLGAPHERATFGSDRAALRAPGFALAAAGVLLLSLALGTLEGPLPLHFAKRLDQAEIAALFVGISLVVAASAAAAGRISPRAAVVASAGLLTGGIWFAGAVVSVPLWVLAVAVVAAGFGLGEAGSLGVLLESVGLERIVLAFVLWSQVWAAGYIAGPALAGVVAEGLGYALVGLVPLAGTLAVLATLLPTRALGRVAPR